MTNIASGLVVSSWNGWERGTPVKVFGVRGSFTFYSARLDDGGNVLWVTVIGGTSGKSAYRHFNPGLVTLNKKGLKRGTKG